MPQEWVTDLKYCVQIVTTNVGGVAASQHYKSDAYDVDAALGSTAMPGFTELAAMYARFRTLRMSYRFDFANQEAFPLTVFAGFSNSSLASGTITETHMGNPLFKNKQVGPLTGEGQARLTGSASVIQIAGTKQALYDDLYTGSTGSSTLATAGTVHVYAAILSPVVLTAAGVVINAVVTLRLQFYQFKSFSS